VPTYSYRCANCGHAFDQYQSFTDDGLTECPNCHEPKLRKVFNSIGVSFTGSGFYRNDSRSTPAESSTSTSSSDSGSAAGSPAAPAAAPASTPAASTPAASKE
jgi:putative FmdB family regulatory protein